MPAGNADPLAQIDARAFGFFEARRLLLRAGFGGTPAQIRALARLGPEGAVDAVLNYARIEYDPDTPETAEFRGDLVREWTRAEQQELRQARIRQEEEAIARFRERREEMERQDRRQIGLIIAWWMGRMIHSPRPAEEKLTLFWHGHFATSYRGVRNSYHMHMQNRLFRAHAAGNFGNLMRGIIRDPAMLEYLDNRRSRKGAPNENLARELMELFSLGTGHYREGDIKEGARALTGYTFEGNRFVFDAQNHDRGGKTILGRVGNLDGDDFVGAILERRACAEFVSGKLHRFFSADAMPSEDDRAPSRREEAIEGTARTLRRNRYELKPALRELLLAREFYRADAMRIKSPVELVAQTARSLNTPTRRVNPLRRQLDVMGQLPMFPPNVAGWPGGTAWINTSTLFARQNAAAYLISGQLPGGGRHGREADLRPLLESMSREEVPGETDGERLCSLLLGDPGHPAGAEADRVLGRRPSREDVAHAAILITANPEYQLC
ncbi:MAG: DUF1800 domain-containing protein [Planctomycetota bacterium]